jgi:hypothetical protein
MVPLQDRLRGCQKIIPYYAKAVMGRRLSCTAAIHFIQARPTIFRGNYFMNPIQTITTTVGIIAILIGLLLPAVQR